MFSINVYKKTKRERKTKKEEQFKHSSRRNTKVCTNTSPNICTRYKLALYPLYPRGLHSARPGSAEAEGSFVFPFKIYRSEKIRRRFSAVSWFWLKGSSQKRRFHSDNVPIHSATCSCFEYDGVLLLIITITVLVIINNYLMV